MSNNYNLGVVDNMKYDFNNKNDNINNYITYMLARTQSMFKYKNLPDTISERSLELFLQTKGCSCITKHDDKLYAFTGGLGGEPDVYYMPTIFTVSNPALKFSKNLKINEDCVVISNDSMYIGLLPLFRRYATQLSENDLSMMLANINTRIISLISASDDRTQKSAEKYLQDISDGKQGIISESALLDALRSQPYNTTQNNVITNLIEYQQYIKASWYNELGLNANYNMKRESINSGESQLNNDMLSPLVDDMLKCRKNGLDKINKMYDTNISVELASSWEDNQIELDNAHEQMIENVVDNTEQTGGVDNEQIE